ncbi:hypothetical protein Tsubulata_045018 [Turnera subulata]|uniref:Uncharacterized protein n=1 Tax=Turnera subulata TaxID=218843 RepID=A0A9Q0J3S4_9ROSI|nr:hypothetical protein Tsubulata_045018 [Turnera subulata]
MGEFFHPTLRQILGLIFFLGNCNLIDVLGTRHLGSNRQVLVIVVGFLFPTLVCLLTFFYFIEIRRFIRGICRDYGRIVGLIYISSYLAAIVFSEENNNYLIPLLGVIAISGGRLILDLDETLPIASTVLAGCLSAVSFALCLSKLYAAVIAAILTIPVVMVALCALALGDVKEWKLRAQAFTVFWKPPNLVHWVDDEIREYSFNRNMGLLYLGIRRRVFSSFLIAVLLLMFYFLGDTAENFLSSSYSYFLKNMAENTES